MKNSLQKHKFLLLGFVFALIIAIVFTTIVLRQTTQTRSKAQASTTLSFTPITTQTTPLVKNVNDSFTVNVHVDPGQNAVSAMVLEIDYDPTVLSVDLANGGFTPIFYPSGVGNSIMSEREGPTYTSGKISVTLDVGNDFTKAVVQPADVATIHFTVIGNTVGSPMQLSINPSTAVVYSVASTDSSQENVLSTTQPFYLLTNAGPTATLTPTTSIIPTATLTPSPTVTPSPTDTPIPQTPTNTPSPTITPTVTPPGTSFNLKMILHGIGMGGDNVSSSASASNKNPQTTTRNVTIQLINNQQQIAAQGSFATTYNAVRGDYESSFGFQNLPTGNYLIFVQTPNFLKKQIPGIQSLVALNNYTIQPIMVTGDVNNDNQLDIQDYNIMLGCFHTVGNQPLGTNLGNCKSSDLNDDGIIDITDINLFVREISVQVGNQ